MSLHEAPETWTNLPLDEIVVRADCMDEWESRGLAENVFEFVERMLSDGHYPRGAIPRDAMLAAAVYDFISTFEDDGLHTFIEGSGSDKALNRYTREGLRRLGFHGFDAIFADLEAFMARFDPNSFKPSGWWKDPDLVALEARFSPFHPIEWYYDQLAEWIRGWPNLRAVPSADIQTTLQAVAERNHRPTP